MNTEFSRKGIWWLPGKPVKKIIKSGDYVTGTLQYHPEEGIELDLIDALDVDFNSPGPEIIQGSLENGKPVTLVNCSLTDAKIHFPGLKINKFTASILIIGAHYQERHDIKFREFLVHFTNLDEWAGITGITRTYDKDSRESLIRYKLPESLDAKVK